MKSQVAPKLYISECWWSFWWFCFAWNDPKEISPHSEGGVNEDGYMYYRFKDIQAGMAAGTEYFIEYFDYNGENIQDFTITLYTEKE